jgi:hypothetical protein
VLALVLTEQVAKACDEKKRETKLARSTSLIELNSQLKLNSKILRTWKKERESFRSLNAQGMRGGGTSVGPFIGVSKDSWPADQGGGPPAPKF